MTLWADIQAASRSNSNGRTETEIFKHLMTEVGELFQEQIIAEGRSYKAPGADGPIGEAVDVILCAADLIIVRHPKIEESALLSNWFGGMGYSDLMASALEDDTLSDRDIDGLLQALVRDAGEVSAGLERTAGKPPRVDGLDAISCAAYHICCDCLSFIRATAPDLTIDDITSIARAKLAKWKATAGGAGRPTVRLDDLSSRQRDALEEFRRKVPDWTCPWKPKTMESLAKLGLTSPEIRFGDVIGHRITDAGRALLGESTTF